MAHYDSSEQMNSSMYLEEEKMAEAQSGQGSRQGSRLDSLQGSRRDSRQESRQGSRQGSRQASRQGSRQLRSQGSIQPYGQGSRQLRSQGSYQPYGQASIQPIGQGSRQLSRQMSVPQSVEGSNERPGHRAKYIPELHDLGREKQRLTERVQEHGIPGQTVPYHPMGEGNQYDGATQYDQNGNPVHGDGGDCNPEEQNMWEWSESGKLKLSCAQPVVPVPIVQDILRRDKIILVPQVEVTDVIAPKVYNQNIKHEVPKVSVEVEDTFVDIPNVRYVEKEVIVPIVTGYTHKFVPKWEIREVPRPILKYIGEQKIVEVEVPEIKYVDKIVEREVVVDTVEKRVPKIIEVPKYTDEVQYVWTPIEKIVYVQKLVPKFDVNLDCPPPLIVPYPVQTVKQIPPVMVKKDAEIPLRNYEHYNVPSGSVRVPEEYIQHFSRLRRNNTNDRSCFFNCCDGRQSQASDQNMSFENVTQQQGRRNGQPMSQNEHQSQNGHHSQNEYKSQHEYMSQHEHMSQNQYQSQTNEYANQNEYQSQNNEYLDSSDSFAYPSANEIRSNVIESNAPSRINESAPSISVHN